jgi:16S rRNA (guanine527-N7)-methyltransferase
LSKNAQQQLITYIEILSKWNKAYNLTSIRKPQDMITRHLFDSLSIAPTLQGTRILDVGTGAGLPGIPLAIRFPEREFVLLDSNGKKIRFLTHLLQILSLPNVKLVEARVEDFQAPCFDSIVSRAFTTLSDMLMKTKHLCCKEGVFLAMKGVYPQVELDNLPAGFRLDSAHRLKVPGLVAERHIVLLRPTFSPSS